MKRAAALLLALLLAAPLAATPGDGATGLPPKLVIAHSAHWKPFVFRNAAGQPDGVLVDIWRAFGAANGVEVEFLLGDWQQALDWVREGRADLHGGLLYSEARDRELDFSRGYMDLTARLLLAPDTRLDSLSGIGGLPLGAVRGSYESEYVRVHYPRVEVREYTDYEALVRAALVREVAAIVADYPVAMFYLHTLGDPEQLRVAQALYTEPLRVAVRDGNVALLESVNAGIEALDPEEIERIQQKWMRAQPVLPRWLWSALVAGAALAVLLSLGVYAALLRATVRRRTRELAQSVESLAAANTRLEIAATTDGLTGMPNRRAFFEALAREERRARRYAHPLAVVMLDIDHFKRINDTHGHAAGDAALVHATALLRAQLRESDTAGRLGGEEFALLLPETGVQGAVELVSRVLQATREAPLDWQGQPVEVRFSAGITALGAADNSGEDALARADAALYRSKHAGRDRLTVVEG